MDDNVVQLSILYLRCAKKREEEEKRRKVEAFNSLFEMRATSGWSSTPCRPSLSILYLRCILHAARRSIDRVLNLSILYLRCSRRSQELHVRDGDESFQFSI